MLQDSNDILYNCRFPTLWYQFGEELLMSVMVRCPYTLGHIVYWLQHSPISSLAWVDRAESIFHLKLYTYLLGQV